MEDSEETSLEGLLMCPVCQDIFEDPQQLPCGHSLCLQCLDSMMDHSSNAGLRCPDCRTHFGPDIKVKVQKSYALANIAEDFRQNRKRREQNQTVYCDCCPEGLTPAVRTCLKCEVSMCAEHASGHLALPVFSGHPLVKPLSDLQKRKCPQHEDEVLRYYCNTSRRYVCNVCALETKQHKLAAEATAVLRRQFMEFMEQHFTLLKGQIIECHNSVRKLTEDIRREGQKLKMEPPSRKYPNGVTVVLLCLWFIVLYYAFNFSVENQELTEERDKQQSHVHQIYSTIAELLPQHQLQQQPPKT